MAELTTVEADAPVDAEPTDLDQLLDVIEETSDYDVMLLQFNSY